MYYQMHILMLGIGTGKFDGRYEIIGRECNGEVAPCGRGTT